MKPIWSRDEIAYLAENPLLNNRELYGAFGGRHSVGAIQKQRERVRHQTAADEFVRSGPFVPKSVAADQVNRTIIRSENVLVVSDFHAPYQNEDFLETLLDLSRCWGLTHCLVNGDLFDHAMFKTHPGRRTDPSYKEELTAVRGIVEALAETFSEVLIDLGNHEDRWLLRILNSALAVEDWARLFSTATNVHVVDYPFVFIYAGREKYVAGHPGQYSKDPAKVAKNIHLEKFPDHHVITGHTHHVGMSLHRNSIGTFWQIDQGHCARDNTFEWVEKSFNSTPHMNNGAVVIKDCQPWLLRPNSPFRELKKMYGSSAA